MDVISKSRCKWCGKDPIYVEYHDKEWGVPVFDDRVLFESLTLETFQAGLSWITVLHKREHFKKAFDNFDYRKIASYNIQKEDYEWIQSFLSQRPSYCLILKHLYLL